MCHVLRTHPLPGGATYSVVSSPRHTRGVEPAYMRATTRPRSRRGEVYHRQSAVEDRLLDAIEARGSRAEAQADAQAELDARLDRAQAKAAAHEDTARRRMAAVRLVLVGPDGREV